MSDTVIDQEHARWLDSEVTRLKRELAEAREVAKNLAILCYASGVGIGTKTMMEYEAMKQRNAPRGGEVNP